MGGGGDRLLGRRGRIAIGGVAAGRRDELRRFGESLRPEHGRDAAGRVRCELKRIGLFHPRRNRADPLAESVSGVRNRRGRHRLVGTVPTRAGSRAVGGGGHDDRVADGELPREPGIHVGMGEGGRKAASLIDQRPDGVLGVVRVDLPPRAIGLRGRFGVRPGGLHREIERLPRDADQRAVGGSRRAVCRRLAGDFEVGCRRDVVELELVDLRVVVAVVGGDVELVARVRRCVAEPIESHLRPDPTGFAALLVKRRPVDAVVRAEKLEVLWRARCGAVHGVPVPDTIGVDRDGRLELVGGPARLALDQPAAGVGREAIVERYADAVVAGGAGDVDHGRIVGFGMGQVHERQAVGADRSGRSASCDHERE